MRSKLLFVIITIMIVAFAGYLLLVAFVGDPIEKMPQVGDLRLTQEGTEVAANWSEEDCSGYYVNCFIDGKLVQSKVVKDNAYIIDGVCPGHFCEVKVRAKLMFGIPSREAKAVIKAEKVKQVIAVDETTYYGFAGNDFKLNATANGDLYYKSTDDNIAEVDRNGRVTLGVDGEAEIIIRADGNGFFSDAERTVSVFVYPAVLDQITGVAVENLSSTKALIRWNPDEYATAYKVFRKNPVTEEFEELEETPYEINYLEVVRNDCDYAVKGIAEVDGAKIDGKISDTVEVRGTTEESPSYSSVKIIGKLTKSDLELKANIYGGKKARIPQSFSVTSDRYIVSYCNRKSSKAYLISYKKKDGSLKNITSANELKHCNGSAYDPYRNRLYVLSGNRDEHSRKCYVYDPDSHRMLDKITLPKAATGIAYDRSTDKFYLAIDDMMYVCDSDFKLEKTMQKSVRYVHTQDIGAYNSAVMVCTWTKKTRSYIDLYRVSDGAYLGSYDVSLGEIESCAVDDGYLVILMNVQGSMEDKIYKTKKRIAIP